MPATAEDVAAGLAEDAFAVGLTVAIGVCVGAGWAAEQPAARTATQTARASDRILIWTHDEHLLKTAA
jgi:hypothetical protein